MIEDLIEIYKAVNGIDEVNWKGNPVINTLLTRSNEVKIRKKTFKLKIRNDFANQSS